MHQDEFIQANKAEPLPELKGLASEVMVGPRHQKTCVPDHGGCLRVAGAAGRGRLRGGVAARGEQGHRLAHEAYDSLGAVDAA